MERLKWYIAVSPGLPSTAAVPFRGPVIRVFAEVAGTRNVVFVDFALRSAGEQKPVESGNRDFCAFVFVRDHSEGLSGLEVATESVNEQAALWRKCDTFERDFVDARVRLADAFRLRQDDGIENVEPVVVRGAPGVRDQD